jgi:hypothetical protein
MNKNGKGFIDESVADLLSQGNKSRENRALPRAERARKAKSQQRQEERNGKRGVYDLDPELIEDVKDRARMIGTTASQVVGILLHYGLDAIDNGDIDLGKFMKLLPKNPRYEYELVWHREEK